MIGKYLSIASFVSFVAEEKLKWLAHHWKVKPTLQNQQQRRRGGYYFTLLKIAFAKYLVKILFKSTPTRILFSTLKNSLCGIFSGTKTPFIVLGKYLCIYSLFCLFCCRRKAQMTCAPLESQPNTAKSAKEMKKKQRIQNI